MQRSHNGSKQRGDDGIATVWAVSWIFVCLCVGWLGVVAAVITAAQHHTDAAAELVSLSAARRAGDGDPCLVAADLARHNAVELETCRVDGSDVLITVMDDITLPFGISATITAHARAGP